MAMVNCFWFLLSIQQLEVVYVPPSVGSLVVFDNHDTTIKDLILHRSFYDFIHPEEFTMAKHDLSAFLRRKPLAGAITRCQLRSFPSIAKNLYPYEFEDENVDQATTWNIVDVVMYIVTEHMVLTFFHQDPSPANALVNYQKRVTCGESFYYSKDIALLLSTLENHQPQSTLSTITISTNDLNNGSSVDVTKERVFQIYDQATKQRLLSWPPSDVHFNVDDPYLSAASESTTLTTTKPSQLQQEKEHINTSSCMQLTHSHSRLLHSTSSFNSHTSSDCRLERIVISYGSILFCSFQIDFSEPSSSSTITAASTSSISTTVATGMIVEKQLNQYHLYKKDKDRQAVVPSSSLQKTPIPSTHRNNLVSSAMTIQCHPTQNSSSSTQRQEKQKKRCVRCGTINSPEWRRGPTGHKT
ncbi:uncharacterized protein BX664DRAFT_318994 [Halteromyces radiatus]|uniref:uncharacterized protein n=1 Tax=Halteromyces radiatus TaxID=101107 RepID=UPI00221F33EF|nr:uncharacterized protein BX664DRAFT_318994 [Halteromyces radiatus]KAI8098541.1 hypothetical protein BX664DRAFT_318994 [Halteromyces radiatus]